jgi:hypothetical protein
MPLYMTQKMSYGTKQAITYYRKQKNDHPDHKETLAFTNTAKQDYATANGINENQVELGTYRSGQGVPAGGHTKLI